MQNNDIWRREMIKSFTFKGKDSIEIVNWLLDEESSNKDKAVYFAYDSNLYPLPYFSTWKDEEYKQKQVKAALYMCKGFKGEVWLDDVKIRGVL